MKKKSSGKRKISPRPPKTRFPRLATPPEKLARGEQLLRATFNRINKDMSFSKKFYNYDIYKTKRGLEAKRCFIIAADMLAQAGVDPSLYLKVLRKYGKFHQYRRMPPVGWLRKPEALNVFKWLVEQQRKRYPRNEDWHRFLNYQESENSRHIGKAIKRSWVMVKDVMDAFDLKIGEAALIQADRLSPWFLCLCSGFHSLGGMDLLDWKDQELIKKCLNHLIRDRYSQKEALNAYGKFID